MLSVNGNIFFYRNLEEDYKNLQTFYKYVNNSYYDCCVVVKGLHSGLPKQTIFVRKIKEKENCYDNLCVTYNVKSQQKNRNPYQHWQ